MPDQPSAGAGRVPESNEVARQILGILLERQPALMAIEELVRYLGHPDPKQAVSEIFVRDGVGELVCSGLAHQLGEFVFASYSAVRIEQLSE